uniref:Protein krueppel n=1 Tax=Stomoxys calcitrans TaxID=35570 RepID=A0A1I8PR78_STOCA
MDLENQFKPLCRICMHPFPIINWDEELYDFSGTSYKNCFYKYTNLEKIDMDPFPQLLCGVCAADLQSFHFMIEKAIESHKMFEKQWEFYVDNNLEHNYQTEVYLENDPNSTLIEHPDDQVAENVEIIENIKATPPPQTQTIFVVKKEPQKSVVKIQSQPEKYSIKGLLEMEIDIDDKEFEHLAETVLNREQLLSLEEALIKETKFIEMEFQFDGRRKKNQNNFENNKTLELEELENDADDTASLHSHRFGTKSDDENTHHIESVGDATNDKQEKRPRKKRKYPPPAMCSYCSKLIYKPSHIKHHEAIHHADRARDKVCNVCGFKTFTLHSLKNHMRTHDRNREKTFKCEFCDKAFFNRGACNVHRRLHLGLMIKCTLCPKEYSRQIDLDKHMVSHSHTALHSGESKFKKKKVQCKICNKIMNSNCFAAHRAAHLNEPMMKCILCQKDYFNRTSCMKHMRTIHKRTDKCEDIIYYYVKYKPRLTSLLREQQELATPVAVSESNY